MLYQQGDVLIEGVTVLLDGLKRVKRTKRGLVLAEGEATGHAHVIADDGVELYERDGVLYLSVKNGATVTHEEHKPVTLPAGDFIVRKVREYDHFEEEAREVRD